MSSVKNILNILNIIIDKSRKIFVNKKIKSIFCFLFITIVFSLAFRQTPIYQQNQHTKFLHGIAKAGYGYLKNDWFAKTIDPLPVFSFLVFLTIKYLNEYFFYIYYIIILGVFIYSILKISDTLYFKEDNKTVKILFFCIIITLHSTFLDSYFFKFFKYRITALLMENGVAQQYLLGSYFQPCVFGVFLLLSVFIFLKNKPFLSILLLSAASIFHSAYIFSQAILTLSYMIIIYKEEKDFKKAILLGLFSFTLVFPVFIYNFIYLGPTSKEITSKALDILVNERISVHADPKKWIDINAILKLIIILISALLVKKKRIFMIVFIPITVAVLSTILQLFFDNDFIGFLAPWRVSSWLVPLSTSIIVGYLINIAFLKISFLYSNATVNTILKAVCFFIIFFHVFYGLYGTIKQFDEYRNLENNAMINFVKENKSTEDIYLIPPKLFEFRLNTGVPVFVTTKSHPYKDVELLEWHERVKLSKIFYDKNNENKCNILVKIKEDYKITHVVLPEGQFNDKFDCLKEIYKDKEYGVYKIR